MSFFYKISNTWKKCSVYYKNTNDTWKEVKNIWYKTTSGWKPVWQYAWVAGSWSECSVPCGGGIQTRTVNCTRNDGVAKPEIFCAEFNTKPSSQQDCNTQGCNLDINVGGQQYKCFVTEKSGGPFAVSLANARPIGSVAYGDATNWTWPYPIVVGNPYPDLTPPLTLEFISKWNARFGDRSVRGYLYVDTDRERIVATSSPSGSSCCVYIHAVVTINYIPAFLNLYHQIYTSKSNQHMACYLSYAASAPMIKCTDARGNIYRHY